MSFWWTSSNAFLLIWVKIGKINTFLITKIHPTTLPSCTWWFCKLKFTNLLTLYKYTYLNNNKNKIKTYRHSTNF